MKSKSTKTKPKPFAHNPHRDRDRRAIWDMLMTEDFEGWCSGSFGKCKKRFDRDFCGYTAHFKPNPDDWTMKYPILAPYEKDWLESARWGQKNHPKNETWMEFFDRSVHLDQIDIAHGRALARKKFWGTTTLRNGKKFPIAWQTHYWLRKRGNQWKITGFIGYLPYDGK